MKKSNDTKILSNFEIEAKDFFSLMKKLNIENGKHINDLRVYAKVISLILGIPMKSFNGEFYIPIKEVQRICGEEFKYLSKNWKE